MKKKFESIYHNSPHFMQNLMISGYGIKLFLQRYGGKAFTECLRDIRKNVSLSEDEIRHMQLEKLKQIVRYAYNNVPYYNEEYRRLGASPDDIKGIGSLKHFPIITKRMIAQAPEKFISSELKGKKLISIFTSGTSGTPLTVYCTKDALRKNYAFFARLKEWAGVSFGGKNITFAGRIIHHPDNNKPPFWRYNRIMNNILFSSYHLSEKNLPFYIDKINEFKPALIDSYPSAISVIANFALDNNISMHQPKAIITSSETLFDNQRAAIEKAFNSRIYDHYGSAEMAANVYQCRIGTYHVNPDYGIIEILDGSGKDIIGQPGEMICTGFINPVMPLIRYRIGDSATGSLENCACGCNFPVLKSIEGRLDDLIITKDGKRIGRLDPIFKGLRTIHECQIVQEADYNIKLNIVKGCNFDESEIPTLIAELKKRIGSGSSIKTEYLESIPRTPSGKFRAVISHVGTQHQP